MYTIEILPLINLAHSFTVYTRSRPRIITYEYYTALRPQLYHCHRVSQQQLPIAEIILMIDLTTLVWLPETSLTPQPCRLAVAFFSPQAGPTGTAFYARRVFLTSRCFIIVPTYRIIIIIIMSHMRHKRALI